MKPVVVTQPAELDPLTNPKTAELAQAAQFVLRQRALLAAWPVVIRLLRRVVDLTIGNGFLDQQWRLVKQENQDLYRLLSTLAAQNGGRLVLDEELWRRTRADKRLLGKITTDGNAALVLTGEDLLTRRPGVQKWFDGDGREDEPVWSNAELVKRNAEEPIYSPIFDVTRLHETVG